MKCESCTSSSRSHSSSRTFNEIQFVFVSNWETSSSDQSTWPSKCKINYRLLIKLISQMNYYDEHKPLGASQVSAQFISREESFLLSLSLPFYSFVSGRRTEKYFWIRRTLDFRGRHLPIALLFVSFAFRIQKRLGCVTHVIGHH